MTGESAGSTANVLKSGFFFRMNRVTPVIVPPVPTPLTIASMLCPLSSQISGPVVASWIAGFAGFSNCCGIHAPGVCCTSSFAFSMAPRIPFSAGVSTSSAPSAFSIARRSRLMDSGMVRISRYFRAAATNASAMPVLPLVGSMMTVSFFKTPRFSASSIIATPIRSLTLPIGLCDSIFRQTSAPVPAKRRPSLTRCVRPIVSITLSYVFICPRVS